MSSSGEPRRSARLQTRDPQHKSKLHEDFEVETKKSPAIANATVGTKNKRGRPCKPRSSDDDTKGTKDPETQSADASEKPADRPISPTVPQTDNEVPAAATPETTASGSVAARQQISKSTVSKRLAHTRSNERKPGRPPGKPSMVKEAMPASTGDKPSIPAGSRPSKGPIILTPRPGPVLPVFTKPSTRLTSIVKTPVVSSVVKPPGPIKTETKEYSSIVSKPKNSVLLADQQEPEKPSAPVRDDSAAPSGGDNSVTSPEPLPVRRASTSTAKSEMGSDVSKLPTATFKGDFTVERITRPRSSSSYVSKKAGVVGEKTDVSTPSSTQKGKKEADDSDISGSIGGSSGASVSSHSSSTTASTGKSACSTAEKSSSSQSSEIPSRPTRVVPFPPADAVANQKRYTKSVSSLDHSRASSSHSQPSDDAPKLPKLILQKVRKAPAVSVRTAVSPALFNPLYRANTVAPISSPERPKISPAVMDSNAIKKAAKSVQKIPTGTSVIIRRGDANKAPLPDVPATSTENIRSALTQPPATEPSSVTKPPQTATSSIVCSVDATSAVVDSMSSSRIDETVDEVSKGNFVRSVDSDSTLTASETEAIEARMKESRKNRKDPDSPKRPVNKRLKMDGGVSVDAGPVNQNSTGRSKSKRDFVSPKKPGMNDLRKLAREDSSGEIVVKTEPAFPDDGGRRSKMTSESNLAPLEQDAWRGNEPDSRTDSPLPSQKNSRESGIGMDHAVPEVKPEVPDVPKLAYSFVCVDDFSESDDDCSSLISEDMSIDSTTSRKLQSSVSVPCPTAEPSDEAQQDTRFRTRMRSMSVLSDGPADVSSPFVPVCNSVSAVDLTQNTIPSPTTEKNQRKKSIAQKEVHKIGTMPLTDLGRWKPQDDMKLIMAVQEYRDLLVVHKYVKFSCHFTYVEIQERWFNLLYNKKIAKSACQAMRSCPPDVLCEIQRKTPFTEMEEALLLEIPMLAEPVDISAFEMLLEANSQVFPPFRTAEDLCKHWQVLLAEGRVENSDTICTIPEDAVVVNSERISCFAEMESKMKDADLKNWAHVSGEFAYEMDKLHRQNRERLLNVDKEIEHLRFLLERAMNYELPDFTRPEFCSPQERTFVAVLLGQRAKFGLRTGKVSFGRSVPGHTVDVDLSVEGYAGRISRLQGYIILDRNGIFRIENHGRRPVTVDETVLQYGDFAVLPDEAMIQVSDIYLQFFVNTSRVLRFLRQKYYGEWISDDDGEEPDKERKKTSKNAKKVSKPKKIAEQENVTDLIPLDIPSLNPKPKKTRAKPKKMAPEIEPPPQSAVPLDSDIPPGPSGVQTKQRKLSRSKPKATASAPVTLPVENAPIPPPVPAPVLDFPMRMMGPNHLSQSRFPLSMGSYVQQPMMSPARQGPVMAHPAFGLIPPLPHHLLSTSNAVSSPVSSPTVSPSRSSTPNALRLPSISDLVPKAASTLLHNPVMEATRSPMSSPKSSPTRRAMVRTPVVVRSFESSPVNPATPHIMRAPPSIRTFMPGMETGMLPAWPLAPLRNTAPISEASGINRQPGGGPTSLVGHSVLTGAAAQAPMQGMKKSFSKAKAGGGKPGTASEMTAARLENGVQQESSTPVTSV